ncbi:hypothetical protein JYU34_002045 [Plutella xylostella]|uniref:Calpain catalytic domain-containing protein n=1 Tax=Plutella xylostella TaxID=51655 RepID=A0ABQ7R5D6_PLUXY|nr:hypothetical protein JYU34_002045 [Plutella xylostella]
MRKFMRTRAPAPPPLARPLDRPLTNGKTNGHANGVASMRDDHLSTASSRPWSPAGEAAAAAAAAGGKLWEDPEFPPSWRALADRKLSDVVWLRPHELSSRPVFLGEDGSDPDDTSSDDFDARWSLEPGLAGGAAGAALSALALAPRLLRRVLLPRAQGFTRQDYDGSFTFMFWEWGTWREVTVDDRLPTRRGRLATSHYSHSARRDDFTLPLFEKAYAKFYGSFAAVGAGSLARALQDLTGCIVQSFPLGGGAGGGRGGDGRLAFHVLNSAVPRSTLLVATVEPDKDGSWRRLRCGLVAGQAYTVTGLARVRAGGVGGAGGEVALVRLRAAGGRGAWAGPWARGSAEWRALSDRDRELLAERHNHHGEFWMSFTDFSTTFSSLCLVHVGPDDWLLEPALRPRRPWRAVLARRRWRAGYNAGGDPTHVETCSTNPQFHVSVPREEGSGDGKCHVVVSVCQHYRARGGEGRGEGGRLLAIGFAVYEVPRAAPRTAPMQLHDQRPLDVTHGGKAREVVTFFTLPPGDYVVVPHTRLPHQDRAFLLRILTDKQTNIWEVNEDNVIIRDIASEFLDQATVDLPPSKPSKFFGTVEDEIDVEGLLKVLKSWRRRALLARPSRELARALLALADRAGAGRLPAAALPRLLQLLHYWRHIYLKYGGCTSTCGGPRASSYRLRALLWAAGLSASNKVLECLCARHARGATLAHDDLVVALARLHLAHERYRSLETKLKSNPLSLEELILMTIYS